LIELQRVVDQRAQMEKRKSDLKRAAINCQLNIDKLN